MAEYSRRQAVRGIILAAVGASAASLGFSADPLLRKSDIPDIRNGIVQGGGVARLSQLIDVSIPGPSVAQPPDKNVLTFNASIGKWDAEAPGGFSGKYADLDFTGSDINKILTRNLSELTGQITLAQLVAHNLLSAQHGDTLTASPVLGDLIAANSTPAWARIAGDTSNTRKFLRGQSSGGIAQLPTWDTLVAGDIPSHALLDAVQDSDTVAGTVVRGDLIIGNSTPKWARVGIGSSGQYLGSNATDTAWTAFIFTKGGTQLSPTVQNIIIWRAPFACTVTNVRGYQDAGTGSTFNARKNGSLNHLASAASIGTAATWIDGGAVQNTAYAAGDKLELMYVTVAGSPTMIAIQVDFTRP